MLVPKSFILRVWAGPREPYAARPPLRWPPPGAALAPRAVRRRRVDRRVEVVAERCAKRLLITLGDGDAVDDRRPQILGLAVDKFRNRARLGLQPLHALVGLSKRRSGGFQSLPRGDM